MVAVVFAVALLGQQKAEAGGFFFPIPFPVPVFYGPSYYGPGYYGSGYYDRHYHRATIGARPATAIIGIRIGVTDTGGAAIGTIVNPKIP